MKKFLKGLDQNFERYLSACLMIWIVGWTFFQVLSRYVLKGIYWSGTEEMARYSFIWMVMMGSTLLILDNDHLKVDILKNFVTDKFGKKYGAYIDIFWELVSVVVCAYLLPYAWKVFYASYRVGRKYPSSGMPQAVFQFSLVFLCAMSVVRGLEVAIRQFIKIRKGEEDDL